MELEDEFVNCEQAKELKKLGFKEKCIACYVKFGDNYLLQLNPLKLDDTYNIEPLNTFYNKLDRNEKSNPLITYNFNEEFEELSGEGIAYEKIYSAPLHQQAIRFFNQKTNNKLI